MIRARHVSGAIPLASAFVLACTLGPADRPAGAPATDVRLVLQITVGGLREDLLDRDRAGFGAGGFVQLLETGTVYPNAYYEHANTEAVVGHTTLATGAQPSDHGMIGNVWYDRAKGGLAYCIEDPGAPLLPPRAGQESPGGAEQLDPFQRQSRTTGRSPRALRVSTFGDALAKHTAGAGRIFAVSGVDRGAVPMAGQRGKAFWYSADTGDFVTSRFYYDAYPDWVAAWNGERRAAARAGSAWSLPDSAATYRLAAEDDRPFETGLPGYGRVFPHPYGTPGDRLFFTRILASGQGDRLLASFAQALLVAESLGQDAATDYLSVSFSSLDVVERFFGPSSLESEVVLRELDRTLAGLLAFVGTHVGLDRTLIVLSADHGMPDMPEAMVARGIDAGRVYSDEIVARANAATLQAYAMPNAARSFFRPYVQLDPAVIDRFEVEIADVEDTVAAALTESEGIALAVGNRRLATQPDTPLVKAIMRNHDPTRSGNVYVAQDPYWFLFEKGPIADLPGSPWKYDTNVPLIFAGPGVPAQVAPRRVHPTNIVPTLAKQLGIPRPSAALATPLVEVLGMRLDDPVTLGRPPAARTRR